MKPQKNPCAVARLPCSSVQHTAEYLERRVLLDGAPQLVKVWFDYAHAPQTINFQFDQDVSASLEAAKAPLVLDNLTTGEEFNDSTDPDPDQAWGSNGDYTQNMTWDPSTDTATFSFPNYNGGTVGVNGVLDDGWYAATLSPQDVQNSAGIALAAPATYQFEYLNGDIAGAFDSDGNSIPDGVINRQDVAAFAVGYNHLYDGPTGYLDGDLNYDGVINRLDVSQFSQDYLFEGQLAPPPTSPGQLVLNPVSTSEIDLAWPQVPNGTLSDGNPYTVTGYRIERSDDGENFYELATVDPNNLNSSIESFSNSTFYYHDTGLGDGQREWYRVRALIQYSNDNDGTTSPYSAYTPKQSTVTTLLGPISINLTAISPTDVQLSFEAGTANATNFEIDRSGDGGSTWAPIAFEPAPSNEQADSSVTYDDTSADPGTDYEYRVIAKNASTNSAPSAPSDISTPMPTVAISGASTVEQNATYDLALSDPSPSVGTVTGWDIYWGDNGDTPEHWDGGIGSATHVYDNYNTDNTIIAYADVTLPDGTTATFASNTVDVTTTPAPPAAPLNLSVTETPVNSLFGNIDVSWSLSPNSDVTSINLQVSYNNGQTYYTLPALDGSETQDDLHENLPETQSYGEANQWYRVQATNSTGSSSFTAPVEITTSSNFVQNWSAQATATGNSITISWSPVSGAAGYGIDGTSAQYGIADLGSSDLPATVGASVTSYTDDSVQPGATYQYDVYAYDSTGAIINFAKTSVGATANGPTAIGPPLSITVGSDHSLIGVDAADPFMSGIPDYANPNFFSHDFIPDELGYGTNGQLTQLYLTPNLPAIFDGSDAFLSFEYTSPSSPTTASSLPSGYENYSNSRSTGFLRIWYLYWDTTTESYEPQLVLPGTILPYSDFSSLWVQGINPGTDTIEASVFEGYDNLATASTTVTVVDAEALLNVTNSGNIAAEPTVNQSGQTGSVSTLCFFRASQHDVVGEHPQQHLLLSSLGRA
jgi:hypothetical protein